MTRSTRQGISQILGLGQRSDDVRYVTDERFGVINETQAVDRWVKTTCGYCSVGCGMEIGVRGGKAVSVKGDLDHPVNSGRLCPKGLSEHQTISAEGRLTQPLWRSEAGGPQRPISWDVAVDTMVSRFSQLLEEHGPESVAVISTGQLVTEEFYTLGKLVRLGFGMAHYDGNTTLCMSSAVSGYKRSFGSDGPPGSYGDIDEADCILLVGANIADNHPLLAPRVLENHDATVIVVDPRVTKTAMMADIHVPLTPRSDIVFLNGLIKVIIDEDMVDAAYVENHTEGFEDLVSHVNPYDAERVGAECGISPDVVRTVARKIGRAERAFVAWTMGVNHSVQGTETVTLLNTLCLLTGNIGRSGAAPFSITGQCNAMGTRETGFTASMPGYRSYDNDGERAELAELWRVPIEKIPQERGRAYPDIIDGILDGTIKGLWIIATNPPVSFPNRGRLEWALSKLDLLVVQDGYETPTTALGHLVLPAAIWGEKNGTYTNSERRVSRVSKAVEPPGEARSDFDIFMAIAERLGHKETLFPGWASPEDAFNEWRIVSKGRLCDYSAITWERISRAGGVQWPCTDETEALGGTPSLYQDGRFPTASGKAKLWSVTRQPIADAPNDQFPFVLNTGRTVEHWHTRTKTGRVDILDSLAPEGWVEVSTVDANRLGIKSGERVRLVSRRGQVEGIPVRVTGIVRQGEVFMPFHYNELCVNRLTVDEFDPISREPNYKQSAVRIEVSY